MCRPILALLLLLSIAAPARAADVAPKMALRDRVALGLMKAKVKGDWLRSKLTGQQRRYGEGTKLTFSTPRGFAGSHETHEFSVTKQGGLFALRTTEIGNGYTAVNDHVRNVRQFDTMNGPNAVHSLTVFSGTSKDRVALRTRTTLRDAKGDIVERTEVDRLTGIQRVLPNRQAMRRWQRAEQARKVAHLEAAAEKLKQAQAVLDGWVENARTAKNTNGWVSRKVGEAFDQVQAAKRDQEDLRRAYGM
jgi:hypothetical protein